eukprot:6357861-Pyramimonas_sp.AAC.1
MHRGAALVLFFAYATITHASEISTSDRALESQARKSVDCVDTFLVQTSGAVSHEEHKYTRDGHSQHTSLHTGTLSRLFASVREFFVHEAATPAPT